MLRRVSAVAVVVAGDGRRSSSGEAVKLKSPTRQRGEVRELRAGCRMEVRKEIRSVAEVEGQ